MATTSKNNTSATKVVMRGFSRSFRIPGVKEGNENERNRLHRKAGDRMCVNPL